MTAGAAPNELAIDLAAHPKLAGQRITAVRHSFGYAMCCGVAQSTWPGGAFRPCPPKSCPVVVEVPHGATTEVLPAVGFIARVSAAGKCVCFPPQVCDA